MDDAGQSEALSQEIGALIVKALPAEWSSAWVEVRIDSGVSSAEGAYTIGDDGKERSFPVTGAIVRKFEQLRDVVRRDGQAMWRSARFSLEATGSFQLSFTYPDD